MSRIPRPGRRRPSDDTSGEDLTDAADGATDEPAADDDTPDDGAEADVLGGEESPDLEEGLIAG